MTGDGLDLPACESRLSHAAIVATDGLDLLRCCDSFFLGVSVVSWWNKCSLFSLLLWLPGSCQVLLSFAF